MYKVITVTEGRVGALLFGGSNLPTTKVEKELNSMDAKGYEMVFMVVETVRNLVFWKRQRIVITMKKKADD